MLGANTLNPSEVGPLLHLILLTRQKMQSFTVVE